MRANKSIAELAYQLWDARGRPHGSEEEDWLEAEQQLARAKELDAADLKREGGADSSLKEPFPAREPDSALSATKSTASGAERGEATTAAGRIDHPPVDETDDAPVTAPGDTGEG
jgi:hypothetical protein